VEKAHFPVAALCSQLEVSRAGFYAWRGRPESARAQEDRQLTSVVRAAFEAGRRYYGSPRVYRELKAQAVCIGRKRVARLMRCEGLRARVVRRYRSTTDSDHEQPIAPNLLARNFQPPVQNQSWASDTTELVTGSGKLYLAAVLDLYSRFVVGWAVSAVNDRHLVIKALDMALRRRCRAVASTS
jgi:transposase InsO family protein